MNLAAFRSRRFFGRLPVFGLLSLTLLVLSSCTNVEGSKQVTLVRVVDASYNAQALDAYFASTPIAVNFIGPSIGNYAFLPPSQATVEIVPTGKHNALAQVSGLFSVNQQHTVYITDQNSGFQAELLNDQTTPAPAGSVAIRFLQQAVSTGAVDVYFVPDGTKIADAKPVLSDVAAGTITAYINISAGTYDVVVAATGTTAGAYTSAATAFTAGQVRTMLIVDQQLLNTPSVNVLTANDVD